MKKCYISVNVDNYDEFTLPTLRNKVKEIEDFLTDAGLQVINPLNLYDIKDSFAEKLIKVRNDVQWADMFYECSDRTSIFAQHEQTLFISGFATNKVIIKGL